MLPPASSPIKSSPGQFSSTAADKRVTSYNIGLFYLRDAGGSQRLKDHRALLNQRLTSFGDYAFQRLDRLAGRD